MKIACLIPARYQSSRFPGKLLAYALGKTILQRTIESALNAFKPEQLFIATDDERIAEHVKTMGAQVIWTHSNHVNGTNRIAEAVLKTAALDATEIIVNLQGDHPCTQPDTLKSVIDILLSDPEAVLSTAATPLQREEDFFSPHVVKAVVDRYNNALYFSRCPIPYYKGSLPPNALQHIGLYCFRKSFLLECARADDGQLQSIEDLEQLKALEQGYRIKVAIVDEKAIGIDTPEDLGRLVAHLGEIYVS
jgi:3-deoxy-manno-octulosonate cytidylyltransferase (CMP-KDO synthetase)